jgi:NAD(P)H-dependent FMN reductase
MLKIGIIVGSTRPGRKGRGVGEWVLGIANRRDDADYLLVDVAEFDLPLLDEAEPASMGHYEHEHTKRWAAAIRDLDGFVFVTPEYNHAPPASLKNALDYLYAEWNDKAAAFVGYGSAGGTRAVEALRTIMAELQIADVRAQVALTFMNDFDKAYAFAPSAFQESQVDAMLDQLVAWSRALATLREPARL